MTRLSSQSHTERVLLVGTNSKGTNLDIPHEIISASWQRCINDFGLDPADTPETEVIEASSLNARRDEMHDFINVARGECRHLYEQISQSGYTIALTDAEGVILEQLSDSGLKKAFTQCGLLPGSVWSEKRRGTNGMGTALQVSSPVIVHREDHFYDTDLGLTCTSSPIFDPQGKVAGVLDVSAFGMEGSWQSQIHTRALVQLAANFIEYHYFQRLYQDHTLLRFHPRSEFLGVGTEALMALDDDGTILAVNDKTLGQLGYEHRKHILGSHINDVFSLKEELLDTRFSQLGHRVFPVEDVHHGRRYLATIVKEERNARTTTKTRKNRDKMIVAPTNIPDKKSLKDLSGNDPRMAFNVRCARRIVDKNISILITGDTGCGKEVFAQAVHDASTRASKPFVALNCAAIPESLIESELFGYKSGAFTGARREGMQGCVLKSSGGTLFLDEIGDMPLNLQTRLLRVLESKEVLPLGSQTPVKVDLHIISASNRDLKKMMSEGEFRDDLYYRLNGMTLTLPPLRERHDLEDIILCVLATEDDSGQPPSIEQKAFAKLSEYSWPGNIRELRNVLRTALALSDEGVVRLSDLPREIAFGDGFDSDMGHTAEISAMEADSAELEPINRSPLENAERDALLKEIERNHWKMTVTAEKLKMSRSTLYRKLKKYGIPITPG